MTADVCKFVDSIAASPTVRLDINDEIKWWVRSFNAPPPRLRRSVSQNAMRDGISVSSSLYDARVVTIEIDLKTTGGSAQDDNATELQKLARELDRVDNFLMYQPTGATKPVFFRLYRSDMSQIENLTGASSFRRPTIELLAEPFAYGLRETLGPFTVNNDPAAGSNGLYFDVTGVIGDLVADAAFVFDNSSTLERFGYLAVRQHGTPSGLTFFVQAESGALGTDTTNPGGGPDAAMSGAGTNNYVRCSFATSALMNTRVTVSVGSNLQSRGKYRVLVAMRRSDATSVMSARVQDTGAGQPGATVALPLTTSRTLVDLGLIDASRLAPARIGYGAEDKTVLIVDVGASRSSGAGTLDIDYVAMIPADEAMCVWDLSADLSPVIFDGHSGSVVRYDSSNDPLAGTAWLSGVSGNNVPLTYAGSIPRLAPNQTNRVFMLTKQSAGTHAKADTNTLSIHYWPRYEFVRPSAT